MADEILGRFEHFVGGTGWLDLFYCGLAYKCRGGDRHLKTGDSKPEEDEARECGDVGEIEETQDVEETEGNLGRHDSCRQGFV